MKKLKIITKIKKNKLFKTFLLPFIQVFFVSINIQMIGDKHIIGIILSSFMISYIWTHNVQKAAISTEIDKIIYALGACSGSATAFILTETIKN